MNAFLVCCLAGVGGIGKRGVFWVGCGDVQGGTSFCAGFDDSLWLVLGYLCFCCCC